MEDLANILLFGLLHSCPPPFLSHSLLGSCPGPVITKKSIPSVTLTSTIPFIHPGACLISPLLYWPSQTQHIQHQTPDLPPQPASTAVFPSQVRRTPSCQVCGPKPLIFLTPYTQSVEKSCWTHLQNTSRSQAHLTSSPRPSGRAATVPPPGHCCHLPPGAPLPPRSLSRLQSLPNTESRWTI